MTDQSSIPPLDALPRFGAPPPGEELLPDPDPGPEPPPGPTDDGRGPLDDVAPTPAVPAGRHPADERGWALIPEIY